MNSLRLLKRHYGKLGAVLVLLAAITVVGMRGFLGSAEWQLEASRLNGAVVFEPHLQNHPGHLNLPQAFDMATKINIYRTVFGEMSQDASPVMAAYNEASMLGKPAPDFELRTTDGTHIRLSDNRGKISVFMFVAMTCPPARIQVPLWTSLAEKYDPLDVNFFLVYSRERHPGEPGYREFAHTSTDQEKLENALMMSKLTNLSVAVDGIDERVLKDYGQMMNPSFVIDRQGVMVFRSSWADANKIDQVLDYLTDETRIEATL